MGHVRSHTGRPRASARPGQRGVRGHVLQESVGQAEILVVPSLKRFQRFRNRIWGPEVPICLGFGGAQCRAMKNMAGIRGQGRPSARRACFETGQVLASPFPATDALVLLEKADASVQTRRGRICSVLSSEASGVVVAFAWDRTRAHSAETRCPSTVSARPNPSKAPLSESVTATSKEYKVIPNVAPYVTNSEGQLEPYTGVPRGGRAIHSSPFLGDSPVWGWGAEASHCPLQEPFPQSSAS